MVITSFGVLGNHGKRVELTLSELYRRVQNTEPVASKKQQALVFYGTVVGDARVKGKTTPEAFHFIVGDYDGAKTSVPEAARRLAASGIAAIVVSSASHKPDAPCWRVIGQLSAPITPDEHRRYVSLLNGALGGILAPESWDSKRCYFFGRVEGVEYEHVLVDGEPIDSVELTGELPSIEPAERKPAGRPPSLVARTTALPAGVVPRNAIESTISTATDNPTWFAALGKLAKSLSGAPASVREDAVKRAIALSAPNWTPGDGFSDCASHVRAIMERTFANPALGIRTAEEVLEGFADLGEAEQRESFRAVGEGQDLKLEEVLPPAMDLDTMLASLVYIASKPALVAYRDNPLIHLPPETMSGVLASNKMLVQVPDDRQGKEPGAKREKIVKTVGMWFDSSKRTTVYGIVFDPRAGSLCTDENGNAALNLWRPRANAAPDDWQQRVRPFLDHVEYLVPVEAEREAFLDWLAHVEQQPGVLPHRHYLMIAPGTQGTGRGWLTALLAHVWAGHVALDFNLCDSLRSSFNGELSRKLLVTVDEIREGASASRHQTAQRLKSLVTSTRRHINMKYGAQSSELNCARFLVCSNHDDALPLTDEDRRWVVIHNPVQPRSADYYTQLYGLLDPKADGHREFVASVREFLRQRDISAFNPGARAEMNEAKRAAVGACQSDEDAAAARVVREWPTDLIDGSRLYYEVYGALPSVDRDAASRARLLSTITQQAGIVKLGEYKPRRGSRTWVWAVRNAGQWRGQPMRGLVLALEQQRQAWPAVELESDDLVTMGEES